MRQLGVGGLALSTPALLSACGSTSSQDAPTGPGKQVKHFEWLMGPVSSMDMAKAASLLTTAIVTEPVLIIDSKQQPAGHLAESWEAVDPKTYVYKIRQGVKFTDGTPLTAEDVAFSMNRHRDPKVASGLAGFLLSVESIEVTGDHEVTVKLSKPDASWRYVPVNICVGQKKQILQQGKDYGSPGKKLTGTGPFKLTKFSSTAAIEYVANDAYWGREPFTKTLTAQTNITDAQTALLAMRAGAADGTFGVSATILDDWNRIPDITVTAKPQTALTFGSFDISVAPWNDVHVRKAFAYALDRKGLFGALLRGNGEIENSMVPRPLWGQSLPADRLNEIYNSLPVYDYDLDKARAELAKSNYPDGLEATIWYYAGDTLEKIALTWAQGLKQIGVTLKLEVASDTVGTSREENHHDLGFHLSDNWGPDYPDPIALASQFFWSKNARPNYYNEANYKNPQVDKWVVENINSIDQAERADLIVKIMQQTAEDVPYIPIWTREAAVAMSNNYVFNDFNVFTEQSFWVNHISPA